ncbi:nitrilase-related carbon-nitrogen hydrolase [Terrabacter sp. C0L_2]|uniref:nitrilase-related carbon-nitrogen hydrolase n=1 Tax=Terrabacter sp. C0L_2 TaxID=3108389 RepID=UPI002ED26BE7|nr:nitrilase-related carbon-nitrogen hydrolase [Terrabacter sp. C0L_2]
MKSPVRVSLIQVSYGDGESLADRVERVAMQVEDLPDTDLVVLPELWAHGGFASDTWAELAETLDGAIVRRLAAVAARRGFWLHGGSLIERATEDASRGLEGRGLWNTAVLLSPEGELRTTYRKIHRFGFGDGEPRLLEAGDRLVVTDLAFPGGAAVTLGFATCYDLRFPEMFRNLAADEGAGMLIVPAAWPLERVEHWSLLGRARAVENQAWVLQCNTAGTHRGITMGGHSQVIAPTGEVAGALGADEGVLSVEIDLQLVGETRRAFPVLRDRRLGRRNAARVGLVRQP